MKADYRIGISGWTYPPWRGVFFPKKLSHQRELEYASRIFNSIEINGSFYALQRPQSYEKWYRSTPEDFVFSVKANRYITHILRLRELGSSLANFFASGVLALQEKLGPILWQFPPTFRYDPELFGDFLEKLPRTQKEASKLARRHDPWMEDRTYIRVTEDRPIRHAVEIRHPSFEVPEFIKQLRRNKIAAVFADSAGKWPYFEDVTADFVYLRLHGKGQMYVGGYDDASLENWAERLRAWTSGKQPSEARTILDASPPRRSSRDAFVYFDNDVKVRAPFDAISLREKLTGETAELPKAA